MRVELLSDQLDALRTTESLVQSLLSQQVISNEQFGIVLMGLSEAVSLAIDQQVEPSTKIILEYSIQDCFLDFNITYNGNNSLESSDIKANRLKLIEKLTDAMTYREQEQSIDLRFNIVSNQEKLSEQRAQILKRAHRIIQPNLLSKNN